MKINKKTVAVSATALVIMGGAAFAFSTSGQGSGDANNATAAPVTFSGGVSDLWPGIEVPIPVTYTNTNPGSVTVPALKVTVTGTAACAASNYETTSYNSSFVLPASTTNADLPAGVEVKVKLKSDAPDACQGQTVSLNYATS